MTDKLTLYNLALLHLKQGRLGSLTEARDARRNLDDAYDQVVRECLDEGLWNFMTRATSIDFSTSVVPTFGWSYAFTVPIDWVRTIMLSADETFSLPLYQYMEEAGYWYANQTPIYARYISNDPQYGMNLGRWTPYFTAWVAFKLAEYTCNGITGSTEALEGSHGLLRRGRAAKIKAKSNDAMNDPPGRMPAGSWVRSRQGGFSRGPHGIGFDD